MNYYVYDEDGKMIRCFRWRYEAVRFLQDGWSVKRVKVGKTTYQFEDALF